MLLPFNIVTQAANDKWGERSEQTEAKVTKYLSGRPNGCRVTPLAASAFRSNWVLFRKIYDLYESRTGKRWSREEVSNVPQWQNRIS